MSSGPVINVRVVKCPKCHSKLKEPADLPVYRCGRCNTLLEAKNYKTNIEDTNTELPETANLGDTGGSGLTDDKACSSSSQNGSHILAADHSGSQLLDCVTETEKGNISTAQCTNNEVSAGDGDTSGLKELPDFKCYQKSGTRDNSSDCEGSGSEEVLIKRKRRPINSTNGTHDHMNASTQVKGVGSEVDSVNKTTTNFNSPTDEELLSTVTMCASPKEELTSDVIQRQSSGKAEDSEMSSPSGNDIVNQTCLLEKTAATDPTSDVRDIVRKMSKSATTGYGQGYDGSISPHKAELSKKVYELLYELKMTAQTKQNSDRRNERRSLACDTHTHRQFTDGADCLLKCSRYPYTRSEQGINRPCPQNPSYLPFSCEVMHHRHHDEYSSQRQPFHAELDPSVCCIFSLNAWLQRVNLHPCGLCYNNPYCSSTSVPQRHMKSEFPSRVMERNVEANLADSYIDANQARKDVMEKRFRVKCHVLPLADGAPFVTCDQCSIMLQLPTDSFLFKQRFHRLKCGSCSEILKFSVENRTHIVPYVHDHRAPPPIEVKSRSISGTSNLEISFHSKEIQTSCSDHEFGNSFCKSCSTTEGEQVKASNGGGRRVSSRDSSDIWDSRRKRFSKHISSNDNGTMEIGDNVRSSTNKTFNIENYSSDPSGPKQRSSSPLHQLMGYTSISQVFRGRSNESSQSFRNKSSR